MSNYCVVVNFSTIVLYKKQGLKWIFLPIKFWLVRSTSSLPPPYHASSSSFVFSFTRFFSLLFLSISAASFCVNQEQHRPWPPSAPVARLCSSLFFICEQQQQQQKQLRRQADRGSNRSSSDLHYFRRDQGGFRHQTWSLSPEHSYFIVISSKPLCYALIL